MLIIQQMMVLFLIMLIGYCAAKNNILDEDSSKKVSAIVVNIANPAMILSSVLGENKINPKELMFTSIIAVGIFLCLILLAVFIPMILGAEKRQYGVYKVMTVFSNIGFMGFPIISSIYGKDALLYASIFLIPYNILIYTYGIITIQKKEDMQEEEACAKAAKYKTGAGRRYHGDCAGKGIGDNLKKILNLGVAASVVALIVYFGNIPIPGMATKVIEMLANLTAPLSMMVIGASFTSMSLKDMFTDWRLLVFSGIKLLVLPVAGMLILSQFVENMMLLGVCMIMLATPVGSMTAMLAQQYDCDSELSSRGVALTTLLSVATIPIVLWLCESVFFLFS